jgi:PAS domain S-box-containing protein
VITERKMAENALRLSEERYRNLFEYMVRGVVYQDADGRIILANPAAERILGLTLKEMQDGSSLDSRWKAIHEDGSDFPGDTHPSMVALATGNVVENVVMGVFNPKDSEYKWLRISAVPEFVPGESKPFQVYTTFEDITEIKKFEDELKIKDESIESSNPIIMASLAGNLKYANKSFLNSWGYGKEEVLGWPFQELFQESQKANAIMEALCATGNWSGESIAKRKDGSTFDIQISASMIEDATGQPVNLVASFIDITKRKQAELALKESETKLKELLNILPLGYSL